MLVAGDMADNAALSLTFLRYPAENGYFILDSITENFLDLSKM